MTGTISTIKSGVSTLGSDVLEVRVDEKEKSVPGKKVDVLAQKVLGSAAEEVSMPPSSLKAVKGVAKQGLATTAEKASKVVSEKEPAASAPSEYKRVQKSANSALSKKRPKMAEETTSLTTEGKVLEEEDLSSAPCKVVKAATEAPSTDKEIIEDAPSGNKRKLEGADSVILEKRTKEVKEKASLVSVAQCKEECEVLAKTIYEKVSSSLGCVKRGCLYFYLKLDFYPSLHDAKDYSVVASLLEVVRKYLSNDSNTSGINPDLLKEVFGMLDEFANRVKKKLP